MDQVWFTKGLGLGSREFEFEFPEDPFWEPSAFGLRFLRFCYGFFEDVSSVGFGFFRISVV